MNRKATAAGVGLSVGAVFAVPAAAQADLVVDNNGDNGGLSTCGAADNDCSLRGAITKANGAAGLDVIGFASNVTGTITLGGTELPLITGPTSIQGPGADKLAISGAGASRIFEINETVGGDPVNISGLKLTGGNTAGKGGAIYNFDSSLYLAHVLLTGNASTGPGGGFADEGGFNGGAGTTIADSTISGNTAQSDGGGIYANDSIGKIARTTVTDNKALGTNADGGGVFFFNGTSTIDSSTISGNVASAKGGGVKTGKYGGGPPTNFTTIDNSVIAGNSAGTSGPDVGGPAVADFDLVQSPLGAGLAPTVAGSNITGVNPQLGPLQSNGGPVPTMKPAPTSPLVDQGRNSAGHDERGFAAPFDSLLIANSKAAGANGADIGAVELQAFEIPPAKKCKKKKHHGKHKAATAKKKSKKCKKKKKHKK
jgi:parallel beta-helix repeat protein